MNRPFAFFIIIEMFSSYVFSQDSKVTCQVENNLDINIEQFQKFNSKTKDFQVDYDSIWCFHPFSINIYSGIWAPLGDLNDYYSPSIKLGASFGLMITQKIKIELGISPIFLNNKKEIEILTNDSIIKTEISTGASLGGWLTYSIYKNQNLYVDLISGITWESLDTKTENPYPKDKYDTRFSISTIGFSFGTDIWINKFGNHNVGIRNLYCFANYNRDELLVSKIGGHSITISLIYRFGRRDQIYRKYY